MYKRFPLHAFVVAVRRATRGEPDAAADDARLRDAVGDEAADDVADAGVVSGSVLVGTPASMRTTLSVTRAAW